MHLRGSCCSSTRCTTAHSATSLTQLLLWLTLLLTATTTTTIDHHTFSTQSNSHDTFTPSSHTSLPTLPTYTTQPSLFISLYPCSSHSLNRHKGSREGSSTSRTIRQRHPTRASLSKSTGITFRPSFHPPASTYPPLTLSPPGPCPFRLYVLALPHSTVHRRYAQSSLELACIDLDLNSISILKGARHHCPAFQNHTRQSLVPARSLPPRLAAITAPARPPDPCGHHLAASVDIPSHSLSNHPTLTPQPLPPSSFKPFRHDSCTCITIHDPAHCITTPLPVTTCLHRILAPNLPPPCPAQPAPWPAGLCQCRRAKHSSSIPSHRIALHHLLAHTTRRLWPT